MNTEGDSKITVCGPHGRAGNKKSRVPARQPQLNLLKWDATNDVTDSL